MSVFDLEGYGYENKFRLANFSKYVKQVCDLSGLFKDANDWIDFFDSISADSWE